jgi:hypothetical protein
MFFKKQIGAAEFGVWLIPEFEHWAQIAISKVATRYRKPTKEETNRFHLEWLLACTSFIFTTIERPTSYSVSSSYLLAIAAFVAKRGQSFQQLEILKYAEKRAELYKPPYTFGSEAAREDMTNVLRKTFMPELASDTLDSLAGFIFMDFTACHRSVIYNLKKFKLADPKQECHSG